MDRCVAQSVNSSKSTLASHGRMFAEYFAMRDEVLSPEDYSFPLHAPLRRNGKAIGMVSVAAEA